MELPPVPDGLKLSIEENEGEIIIIWPVRLGEFRRKLNAGVILLACLAIGAIVSFGLYSRFFLRRGWLILPILAVSSFVFFRRMLQIAQSQGHARLCLGKERLHLDPGAGGPRLERDRRLLHRGIAEGSRIRLQALGGTREPIPISASGEQEAAWLAEIISRWAEPDLAEAGTSQQPGQAPFPKPPDGSPIRLGQGSGGTFLLWPSSLSRRMIAYILPLLLPAPLAFYLWSNGNRIGLAVAAGFILLIQGSRARKRRWHRVNWLAFRPDGLVLEQVGSRSRGNWGREAVSEPCLRPSMEHPESLTIQIRGAKTRILEIQGRLSRKDLGYLHEVLTRWREGRLKL